MRKLDPENLVNLISFLGYIQGQCVIVENYGPNFTWKVQGSVDLDQF